MGAGHDHHHAPANLNLAFGVGIVLNLAFVAIEAFYGWSINSLALLADALVSFGVVLGDLLLDGVPERMDMQLVREHLRARLGVVDVHD